MNMMITDKLQNPDHIRRVFFTVANSPGVGFAEKGYENALPHEMRKHGLASVQQHRIIVRYGDVIIERKATKAINDQPIAQCMNYLRATGKRLCLLINFGRPRIEIRRLAAGP